MRRTNTLLSSFRRRFTAGRIRTKAKRYGYRKAAGRGFFLAALFVAFSSVTLLWGQDWGPSLDPDDWPDLSLIDEEFGPGEPVRPRPLASAPKKSEKPRSRFGESRLVGYDARLAELEEELRVAESLETDQSARPSPRATKASRVMDSTPLPPVRRRPSFDLSDEYYYYDDGYSLPAMSGGVVYDSGTMYPMMASADTGTVLDGGFSGMNGGQYSPALDSGYLGIPIVKPFGTGLLDNLTLFAGADGFKGELDGGRNGNFGFHEGINWSGPLSHHGVVSGQAGFRALQSSVNGYREYERSNRNQYFVTVGAFYRDLSCPFQGGAVFDWVHDDFYGKIETHQVRCELSIRTFSNLEYGFQGGFGTSRNGNRYLNWRENFLRGTYNLRYVVESKDHYTMFLRKRFSESGVVEGRVGATSRGDIVFSAGTEIAMNDKLSLTGGFSTLIPKEGHGRHGWKRESWELSVGFVYHFRGGACSKADNPCRAMFDVAGNGSFFQHIRRR